jgi:Oligosaccharide biosynthesis protein Alg14 like
MDVILEHPAIKGRTPKLLAISSSGGQWEQMMLLREAFSDCEVVYANTLPGLAERSGVGAALHVDDFNGQTPLKTLKGMVKVISLVLSVKPQVILSTGAAPGLAALLVGRLTGSRTIWVDSIANSEKLSLSGRLAGAFVHLQLTQWEHLARPNGPYYAGSVL